MASGDPGAVVSTPANKATGYGITAAAKAAARALGEVADAIVEAVVDNIGLHAAAKRSPAEPWVVLAKQIWADLARTDASLGPVVLADLKWYASFAATLSGKPAVGELDKVGFGAWTNSSTLVLVDKSLFDAGPEVARVMLNHEAHHVRQFRDNNNSPPTGYLAMARFEAKAYSKTLAELTPLKKKVGQPAIAAWRFTEHLVEFFQDASQLSSEAEVRLAMLQYEDVDGDPSPLLPPSAGADPSSLYVP
jgi:hypothetical protein